MFTIEVVYIVINYALLSKKETFQKFPKLDERTFDWMKTCGSDPGDLFTLYKDFALFHKFF